MSLSLTGYVACICEGHAERAIIDILLDEQLLKFERSQMLNFGEPIQTRSAKQFEKQYLGKSYNSKIHVVRIHDSKGENFKLSEMYEYQIEVIDVVTHPEIEMLIILSEQKLSDYQKFKREQRGVNDNASDFCKRVLRIKNVKSYEFVKDYFSDSDKLVKAIKEYDAFAKRTKRIPKGMKTLSDLLRTE